MAHICNYSDDLISEDLSLCAGSTPDKIELLNIRIDNCYKDPRQYFKCVPTPNLYGHRYTYKIEFNVLESQRPFTAENTIYAAILTLMTECNKLGIQIEPGKIPYSLRGDSGCVRILDDLKTLYTYEGNYTIDNIEELLNIALI